MVHWTPLGSHTLCGSGQTPGPALAANRNNSSLGRGVAPEPREVAVAAAGDSCSLFTPSQGHVSVCANSRSDSSDALV